MPNPTKENFANIAVAQRSLLLALLCSIFGWFVPPILLVAIPYQLWAVYRLGNALGYQWGNTAGLILLQFIPVASLIALYAIDRNATDVLKKEGFRVGLMGVGKQQVDEYLRA